MTSDGILADAATGYAKRMPKQIQVAGHEARVRARRRGDDTQLFCVVFKCSEGDVPHPGKRVEDDKTVERLANEFTKVPNLEFSPAEGLSFLLANKQSAGQAVDNVEVWMTRDQGGKEGGEDL